MFVNQGTENTGWLSDAMVRNAATSIQGLDVPRLLADRNSAAVEKQAQRFDAQKVSDKIRVTPTVLVGKSGQTPRQVTLASSTDSASVAKAIAAALG
jgi:hypothetical protein